MKQRGPLILAEGTKRGSECLQWGRCNRNALVKDESVSHAVRPDTPF